MYNPNYNLEILAAAWNRLDIQLLAPKISQNFSYDSQFFFKGIKSKAEFVSHIEAKFNAIRLLRDGGVMSINAEIGYHPSLIGRPCIILSQTSLGQTEKVLLYIEELNDFITSINVCFIPDPFTAIPIKPN
jgi:hypothetical protein